MCILWQQTAETNFSDELIADFYTRNRDGIGFMWAEDGQLCYEKHLPANVQDFVDFYNRVGRGKDGCGHARMKTHGDIDYENCHPYEVFGFDKEHEMPMLLMHNGVLHTGNAADKTKSDTWHYIRNYLHKLLAADPALAFTPEFSDLIGRHIGSNRFAIMNNLGQIAVINKQQGVTFNGAWLSNEYAWSSTKYLPRKVYTQSSYGGWSSKTGKYEGGLHHPKSPAKTVATTPKSTSAGGKKPKTLKTYQPQTPLYPDGLPNPKINPYNNWTNGVGTDCDCLEDLIEVYEIVSDIYPEHCTTMKQLECMAEEMGITKLYLAAEVLGEGLMSEQSWDTLTASRVEMRHFAKQPITDWYPDRATKELIM